MTHKDETCKHLTNFISFISTQFSSNLKCLYSDNGPKFLMVFINPKESCTMDHVLSVPNIMELLNGNINISSMLLIPYIKEIYLNLFDTYLSPMLFILSTSYHFPFLRITPLIFYCLINILISLILKPLFV